MTSPSPCVTRVEWSGSGVAEVEHDIEVGTTPGQALAVVVSPGKPPRSSTVQWNPTTIGSRGPTGRVRAILRDRKNNVLANSDWVDAGFVCGA